jgi:hypothetical protein
MPDFKTKGPITIRPFDEISHSFKITVNTSTTSKDGFLPYGRTISDVSVIGYTEDGTTCTTAVIEGTPSLLSEIVTCVLKYPTSFGDGLYKLKFQLTLDNGETKEANFNRLYCETV